MIIKGYGSNYEIYDGDHWYSVGITGDDLELWWPGVVFDNVDAAIADYRDSLKAELEEELDLNERDLEEAVDRIASSVSLMLSDIWSQAKDVGHYFFVEVVDNGDYRETPLVSTEQKDACSEASALWKYLTVREKAKLTEAYIMRSEVDADGNPDEAGGDVVLYFKRRA